MMGFKWTREPIAYTVTDKKITITTEQHTDQPYRMKKSQNKERKKAK